MGEILFVCPACAKNLAVDSAAAGGRVPCSDCGAWLTVPVVLYVFPCPNCGCELNAPPGMPVESYQCPSCHERVALPSETRRMPAYVKAGEGGTVRVRTSRRRQSVPVGSAAEPPPGADEPERPFAPRGNETGIAVFNNRTFVRRLWLTVFSAAAMLLALIYLDVTFDASQRLFDVVVPRAVRKADVPSQRHVPDERVEPVGEPLPWDGANAVELPARIVTEAPPSGPPGGAPHSVAPPPKGVDGAAPGKVDAPVVPQTITATPMPMPLPSPAAASTPSPAPPSPPERIALPPEIAEVRSVYDQRMEAIRRAHGKSMLEWSQGYLVALQAMRAKMQRAGDLDGWIAARDEGTRFMAEPSIPETAPPSAVAELAALQSVYQERRAALLLSASQDTLATADSYIRYLELGQQNRTRAGQFDEAMLIKAEIDRVKADPAYSEADFHMDVLASKRREPGKPAEDGAPPAASPDAEGGSAETDDGRVAPVIRRGTMGTPPAGVTFERLASRSTGPARDRDTFEVVILRGVASNLQSRVDTSTGLTGSVNETVVRNHVVVGLRTTSRTRRLDAARVTIEYFVRGLGPAEGKEMPRRVTVDTIELPELVNEWVYIDCSPIATRQVSSEYKSAAFTRRTVGGDVLHGIIVSISRRGAKPVYEAVAAVP